MNSRINYIVTTNFRERPIVSGTSKVELEMLYQSLRNMKAIDPYTAVLDCQRCVVTADGKVIYTRHCLTFDDVGLEIRDMYRNLIDSYIVPPPGKKRFKVIRSETWTNTMEVEAESEDEAVKIVKETVREGGFDVLDGYCTDVDHDVEELE